jgi:hypothetical protein
MYHFTTLLGKIDRIEQDIANARLAYLQGLSLTMNHHIRLAKVGIESLVDCQRVYWRSENQLQDFLAEVMQAELAEKESVESES